MNYTYMQYKNKKIRLASRPKESSPNFFPKTDSTPHFHLTYESQPPTHGNFVPDIPDKNVIDELSYIFGSLNPELHSHDDSHIFHVNVLPNNYLPLDTAYISHQIPYGLPLQFKKRTVVPFQHSMSRGDLAYHIMKGLMGENLSKYIGKKINRKEPLGFTSENIMLGDSKNSLSEHVKELEDQLNQNAPYDVSSFFDLTPINSTHLEGDKLQHMLADKLRSYGHDPDYVKILTGKDRI